MSRCSLCWSGDGQVIKVLCLSVLYCVTSNDHPSAVCAFQELSVMKQVLISMHSGRNGGSLPSPSRLEAARGTAVYASRGSIRGVEDEERGPKPKPTVFVSECSTLNIGQIKTSGTKNAEH